MADYHRFVAYIYEYVNGKKMEKQKYSELCDSQKRAEKTILLFF